MRLESGPFTKCLSKESLDEHAIYVETELYLMYMTFMPSGRTLEIV